MTLPSVHDTLLELHSARTSGEPAAPAANEQAHLAAGACAGETRPARRAPARVAAPAAKYEILVTSSGEVSR